MRKIPTLFVRDFDARPSHVLPEVTPGCEWVLAGEGTATRKWDGTCTMLDKHGAWWARREVKPGKTPPPGYMLAQYDAATGKTVGWEPMAQSPFAKIHAQAVKYCGSIEDAGTYELIGPKINGNPEDYDLHILMPHGWAPLRQHTDIKAAPRDYNSLRGWLLARPYEGLVWHHPDGRMAKLKAKDFR